MESNIYGEEESTRHASVTALLSPGSWNMSVVKFNQCQWRQCVRGRVVLDCTAVDLHLANAARSEVEAALKPLKTRETFGFFE